ncbi:MAG: M15 family metallopeptidase [Candidatus Gastranaerophilales bacterium]|nr:M15 family metallopeptidase [Candidatus Gastranaerophilales bacterium]
MKNNRIERMRTWLAQIDKKSILFRILTLPVRAVCRVILWAFAYLGANGKRFAMVAMTFFLFAVYSSFSFPIFTSAERREQRGVTVGASDDMISLADESEPGMMEAVLSEGGEKESEYAEVSGHGYEDAEVYNAEEILQSANVSGENRVETVADNSPGEEYTFSRDDWRLVLINKQHSIPEDYEFQLGRITGYLQCDERIVDDLLAMLQAAKEDGINLQVRSPYRTSEHQEENFNNRVNYYMRRGYSFVNAYQMTSRVITLPGNSEHEVGLALDILCDAYTKMDAGFENTDAGKWLAANCSQYGFILRYPKDKEYYTGISYEPWHFRYVGVEAATVIMERGITLEEFWEELWEEL